MLIQIINFLVLDSHDNFLLISGIIKGLSKTRKDLVLVDILSFIRRSKHLDQPA
jgi:hypothetical protein